MYIDEFFLLAYFLGGAFLKRIFIGWMLLVIFILTPFGFVCADFNITLDPGHGGETDGEILGAKETYDGKQVLERDLNLKIAQFMREEFANYRTPDGQDINVYLTREDNDVNPSLVERVELGKITDSEIVVSLHNNATSGHMNGAMVIVTNSNIGNFYELEDIIGKIVLEELKKLGISIPNDVGNLESGKLELKDGVMRRINEEGRIYEDGKLADWYKITRNGIEKGIPSIIIEHCFLDDEDDYRNFLSSDEKLRNLAIADVNAIARYYGLVLR